MEPITNAVQMRQKAIAALQLPEDVTDDALTEALLSAKSSLDSYFTELGVKAPNEKNEVLTGGDAELAEAIKRFNEIADAPLQRRAKAIHDRDAAGRENPTTLLDVISNPAESDWQREAQKRSDAVHAVAALVHGVRFDSCVSEKADGTQAVRLTSEDRQRIHNSKAWGRFAQHMGLGPDGVKSGMYSTGSGVGDEWVPTGMSAQVIEKIVGPIGVVSLFEEVDMPTNPYLLPFDAFGVLAYFVSESSTWGSGTAPTSSDNTTDARTLTAKKLGALVPWSGELEEDSLIPLVPRLINAVAYALREGEEQGIVNGDTASTHQDSDVEILGTTDRRYGFDGLRKVALAGTSSATLNLSTFSDANLLTLRRLLGVYGIYPGDLAWIVGNSVLAQLQGLDVVTTVANYGPAATILKGEIGQYRGSPVVPTLAIREDMNASGVYDNSTKTKTGILCVNRRAFVIGRRGLPRIRTIDAPNAVDQRAVWASERYCFVQTQTSGYPVTYGYNITS